MVRYYKKVHKMNEKDKLNALVEARLKAYESSGDSLMNDWAPVIGKINEHRKTKGEAPLDKVTARNVAICLENASMDSALGGRGGRLFETTPETTSSNIAFLGVQLPIISALLPSLVLNEIATVQALDRRSGSVFYLDALYGEAKDGNPQGNKFLDAKYGHARSSSARVYASQVSRINVGASGQSTLVATATILPIVPSSVRITDGTEIWVDDGSGALTSNISGYTAGTVNYTTGGIYLAWTSHTATSQPTLQYSYKYESETSPNTPPPDVTSVTFNLYAEALTAIDFPIQTKYTMAAALDLKKAHGMDLESEIVRLLGGEVKFEIDHYGIDAMYNAATDLYNGAGQGTQFNATVGSGQEFVWRKFQFINNVLELSNLIFNKTLRGAATFIVAGNNVSRLIRQLKPEFQPVSGLNTMTPLGPHKIGTLDGIIVIQDPFIDTNTYFAGYKGDSFLMSSFIYAPYIPLFSTPTLVTSDLVAQKGFMSSAGYKVINPGLFAYSTITGL